MTQKQLVVTTVDTEVQSQHCLTIHYTYDETLEGSSCCQLLELVQTHLIFGVKSRGVELQLSPGMAQKSGRSDEYT